MLFVNNTPNDIIISLRFIYINKLPFYVFFCRINVVDGSFKKGYHCLNTVIDQTKKKMVKKKTIDVERSF